MNDLTTTLRSMVQHESEQTHRRLSWLGSFQGFLFAALGFAWGKNSSLILLISLVGLAVALLVLWGMVSVSLALLRIYDYWIENDPQHAESPGIFGVPIRWRWTVIQFSEALIPLVFAIAWIAVLFIR